MKLKKISRTEKFLLISIILVVIFDIGILIKNYTINKKSQTAYYRALLIILSEEEMTLKNLYLNRNESFQSLVKMLYNYKPETEEERDLKIYAEEKIMNVIDKAKKETIPTPGRPRKPSDL